MAATASNLTAAQRRIVEALHEHGARHYNGSQRRAIEDLEVRGLVRASYMSPRESGRAKWVIRVELVDGDSG